MQFNSQTNRVKLLAVERRSLEKSKAVCDTLARVLNDSRGEAAKKTADGIAAVLDTAEEPEPEVKV